jgi:hypothetical protein
MTSNMKSAPGRSLTITFGPVDHFRGFRDGRLLGRQQGRLRSQRRSSGCAFQKIAAVGFFRSHEVLRFLIFEN